MTYAEFLINRYKVGDKLQVMEWQDDNGRASGFYPVDVWEITKLAPSKQSFFYKTEDGYEGRYDFKPMPLEFNKIEG